MTAIIVNDRGEVFTHWASACDVSASGYETYRSVPQFAKPKTIVILDNDFTPYSLRNSRRRHYTVNKPYLFNSIEAAQKAVRRMGFRRVAIVS